jgi:ribosomal protein S18 acetylase RimI-like enzyme
VLVRQLAADDWAELRAARLAALAEAPYAFASTLAREEAYDDALWRSRAGSGRTFGAFDGTAIVGLATGFPVDGQTAPGQPAPGQSAPGQPAPGQPAPGQSAKRRDAAPGERRPDWHLVGMWVAPGWRGQGVADRLVEAVCERARQAGAGTITLWVTEVNERATAFYRRLGFAPTGVRQLVRPEEPDHWEEELARPLS